MNTQLALAIVLTVAHQTPSYTPKGAPIFRSATAVERTSTPVVVPPGCKRRALLQGSGHVIECG